MSVEDIRGKLWVEKYKPQTIDEVLIEDSFKAKFNEFIKQGDLGNLIFRGEPGNGKTTCAKIIANSISSNVLFINASNESGIDVVRTKIIPFCSTMSLDDGIKIVILDEMEMSSENFQTALRAATEDFYSTTRFIMTCNFYNRVIDPLKSRAQEFKFGEINQVHILKRCFHILESEDVEYDKANVAKILKHLGTDMRRIVNTLQRLHVEQDGKKVLLPFTSDEEKMLKMMKLVQSKKLTDFRKYIVEENVNAEEAAVFLFNRAFDKKLTSNNWVEIITILGECIDRMKTSVNPEITLVHHILQVMQLI